MVLLEIVDPFEKLFCPFVHPPDPDTMTITTLEVIASSTGRNKYATEEYEEEVEVGYLSSTHNGIAVCSMLVARFLCPTVYKYFPSLMRTGLSMTPTSPSNPEIKGRKILTAAQ